VTQSLLLDTHVLIWWATGAQELPESIIEMISAAVDVRVSLVSLWEIVLKESTKHPMVGADNCEAWFADAVGGTDFQTLGITARHIGAVQHLERHHNDPFDRLLIAQAIHEGLTLVSRDTEFKKYPVSVVWQPTAGS
jgi:PIN domain nuclease of toxin-antitoxin system